MTTTETYAHIINHKNIHEFQYWAEKFLMTPDKKEKIEDFWYRYNDFDSNRELLDDEIEDLKKVLSNPYKLYTNEDLAWFLKRCILGTSTEINLGDQMTYSCRDSDNSIINEITKEEPDDSYQKSLSTIYLQQDLSFVSTFTAPFPLNLSTDPLQGYLNPRETEDLIRAIPIIEKYLTANSNKILKYELEQLISLIKQCVPGESSILTLSYGT
jgi:hypothetical protein